MNSIGAPPDACADRGQVPGIDHRLEVYADGCFEPRSGTGGWAFVVYRDGLEVASGHGSSDRTSNNAMELRALLEAARWINANAMGEPSLLLSDSVHAVNGCNRWRHVWKSRGWRKKGPDPKARSRTIADRELWLAIDEALSKNKLMEIVWCKGHSGIPGNEKADGLAEFGRGPVGGFGRK
jgi:ribonuclease HI